MQMYDLLYPAASTGSRLENAQIAVPLQIEKPRGSTARKKVDYLIGEQG
jgi:hypothetical protein